MILWPNSNSEGEPLEEAWSDAARKAAAAARRAKGKGLALRQNMARMVFHNAGGKTKRANSLYRSAASLPNLVAVRGRSALYNWSRRAAKSRRNVNILDAF